MGKKLFSMLLCLVAYAGMAFAQNVTVTGTVTEASNGAPIPGATVMIDGTLNGTSTDANGKYSISVSSIGKLVFSVIGFETLTIPVNGRTVINVELEEDKNVLEDAVVVGYGSAKKLGSLVGSVATVKSEILKNAPSSSALDALQGQVAGLSVLSSSGVAGDNAVSMTIHGVGSLGASSTPLYIIDGIPSSSRAIMGMNPNDIKNITVMKDASATSIYGARAANGVVYVTTKSGSYNSQASVTVRSQYGVSTLADMTLYKSMMGGPELMEFWEKSGIYTAEQIKKNFVDRGYTHDTKWYNYYQQFNNPQYQNDVSIEGGGSKIAYMIGGSQFHQRGTSIGNYYDRYTLRSNVQGHPKDWLKVGLNLGLNLDKRQQNSNWGNSGSTSNSTRGGLSFLLLPLYPAVDENGNLPAERFSDGRPVPQYQMSKNPDRYDRYGANGNFFVEIEPVKNLKFTSRAGVDGYIVLDNWISYPSYYANAGSGEKGKSTEFDYSATITNTIEYAFDINPENHVSLLVGHEGIANFYDYYYAQSDNQTDDRLVNLQNGTQDTYAISESHTESKFLSFFAHADYSFADKYIIDATVRNDACSRFGKDNRNAWFWSAGAMWKIKKEEFMRNSRAFNDLNLKVSYGTQGNAGIGDYDALAKVGTTTSYATKTSKVVSSPSNNGLTWEKQALLNVALTGRAFNFLDFDIAFYNRQTSSMLMSVPYPYTAGFSSLTDNVGGLRNRGVDVTLGFDIIQGRDYNLRVNTTFNYNKQVVTELFGGRDRWEIANTGITYKVGQPVSFYYPMFAGIDPTDGAPTWYVPGDDMTVTTMDPNRITKSFNSAALTQCSGKVRYAPINGGFGFSGRYKGLSLQADFSYVLGKTLISNDGYFYANPFSFSTMTTHKMVADFWTPENPNAKWPAWGKGYVMQFDSHLLEDASFLRLKNLQVGYSLPKRWLDWTGGVLSRVRITYTGRNLLTFTKYDGIDPEVNSNLTYGKVGNTKQHLGGIEITF